MRPQSSKSGSSKQLEANRKMSVSIDDAFLCLSFDRRFRLRRQLKYRCFLAAAERREQNYASICKFERIMIHARLILVDLAEDCRGLPDGEFLRCGESVREQEYLFGEGKLRSRKNAPKWNRSCPCRSSCTGRTPGRERSDREFQRTARAYPHLAKCSLAAPHCLDCVAAEIAREMKRPIRLGDSSLAGPNGTCSRLHGCNPLVSVYDSTIAIPLPLTPIPVVYRLVEKRA